MSILDDLETVFAGEFMQPQIYRGEDIADEILAAGLDLEDDGIYCRLSAPGYLDCTDWYGPFRTVEEAAEYLLHYYG